MALVAQSVVHSVLGVGVTASGIALLADAPTEEAGRSVLLLALGGVGTFVVAQLWKLWDKRQEREDKARTEKKADEDGRLVHVEKLLERETTERKELQRENAEIREELTRFRIEARELKVWIRHLEEILKVNKIPVDRWTGEGEVRPHGPTGDPE